MSEFEELYNDQVRLNDESGTEFGPFRCIFNQSEGVISFFLEQLPLKPASVCKVLPTGERSLYDVKDIQHHPSFMDRPAKVVLRVQKQGLRPLSGEFNVAGPINITNSPGALVGVGNTQNITQHIIEIGTLIQNSNLTPEKKKEALTKLKEFFAHPAVVEAVGAVTGVAVDRLWPR